MKGKLPPHVIYFLWKEGVIIYIGLTGDLTTRLKTHVSKGFDRVTFIDTDYWNGQVQEKQLIAMFRPEFNKDWKDGVKIGRGSKGKKCNELKELV